MLLHPMTDLHRFADEEDFRDDGCLDQTGAVVTVAHPHFAQDQPPVRCERTEHDCQKEKNDPVELELPDCLFLYPRTPGRIRFLDVRLDRIRLDRIQGVPRKKRCPVASEPWCEGAWAGTIGPSQREN